MTEFALWLATSAGQTVAVIDDFLRLEYARTVNDVGALTLDLSYDFKERFGSDPLPVDAMLTIQRTPVGGAPGIDTDTVWFVRSTTKMVTPGGNRLLRVQALSAVELLARRVVAYSTGKAQAKNATGELAGNLMKRIVTQQLLTAHAVYTSRTVLSAYLSVAGNLGDGAVTSKKFAWRNVLQTIQEIAKDSDQQGDAIYFDVVVTQPPLMEFRTFPTQRGVDHTSGSVQGVVTLSIDTGSLTSIEWGQDRMDEVTAALAGVRKGAPVLRTSSRRLESPFNWRESFVDASMAAGSTASANSAADAELRRGRPKRHFAAEVLDVEGARYGLHWAFGDAVQCSLDGEVLDAIVESIHVSVEGGKETIQATMRVEDPEL